MSNLKYEFDYYETLEVRENASTEVIRMAYKALALKYHPDKSEKDQINATKQMQKINEAFSVLSDINERKRYDEYLRNQREKVNVDQKERSDKRQTNQWQNAERERQQAEFRENIKNGAKILIING